MNESEAIWGDTVLHSAAGNGHLDMCQLFVNTYKIDCNVENKDKYTPLHFASLYGRTNIIRFLLNEGAAINAVNKKGQTPLLFAIHCGHRQTVEFLLRQGADVNIRDIDGKSSAAEALESGSENIARMIEEHERGRQQSTSVDINRIMNLKLDLSYASRNNNDEEIELAREKLRYLEISARLKSN